MHFPKHVIHRCLRCLKILFIHNCRNLFFVLEPLWNSDKQTLSNFRIDFFYRSVRSPFAIKLFSLPFSYHCSTQNISFSDCAYVIKPPQLSSAVHGAPPFTVFPIFGHFFHDFGHELRKSLATLLQGTLFRNNRMTTLNFTLICWMTSYDQSCLWLTTKYHNKDTPI